eukprot:1724942-Ditylum_brightwellii.AAC.1
MNTKEIFVLLDETLGDITDTIRKKICDHRKVKRGCHNNHNSNNKTEKSSSSLDECDSDATEEADDSNFDSNEEVEEDIEEEEEYVADEDPNYPSYNWW